MKQINAAHARWLKSWRILRIARREAMKAADDLMLYGSGFVRFGADGVANHVRPWAVTIKDGEAISLHGKLIGSTFHSPERTYGIGLS